MILRREDIICHLIDDKHVCWGCLGKNEYGEGKQLTERDVDEEDILKCDRCGDVIWD